MIQLGGWLLCVSSRFAVPLSERAKYAMLDSELSHAMKVFLTRVVSCTTHDGSLISTSRAQQSSF
jgi:hypothetical protein